MRASLAVTAIGAVLLAACAGGATSGSASGDRAVTSDQTRRIDVEMKGGFAFAPRALTLKAGERVVISFKNSDTVEHEFMAGRQATGSVGFKEDLLATARPEIVAPSDHDAGHGGHGTMSVGIRLKPGQTGTVSFVVPELVGEHEYGCFIAGHHESGMRGKLTISR